MDPTTLPGMPAPFWFVQLFKVIGFVLHMIPMGLWFAGLPVAIGCALWNCRHSRRFARRMFGQFPIIMALGINFGIVPLLFLQTTYYKSFFTATVLMAWHWLAVIPILIVGYYALYLAAFSRQQTGERRPTRMIVFGVIASVCLVAIGILMTNGLTLMVRSDLWPGIMERTNHFGATTGLANNMSDPAVWLRLATMFALGLMTTGVWTAFDSHFLLKTIKPVEPGTDVSAPMGELNEYRRWTLKLAVVLSYIAIIPLFVAAVKGWCPMYPNMLLVPILALPLPIYFHAALIPNSKQRMLVILATITQVLTLACFGIIRQIGQNAGVADYVDVSKIPTAVQWTPLIAFLVCFVLGLGVIGWMLRQCMLMPPENTDENPRCGRE